MTPDALIPTTLALQLLPDGRTLSAGHWITSALPLLPMFVLLAVAAVLDAKYRRIPNWLNLGLIVGGLAASTLAGGFGLAGLGGAAIGVTLGFALTFPAFVLRVNGGGDVKLLAALGAWLGWEGTLAVFAIQAILGLVLVLVQAAGGGKLKQLCRNCFSMTVHLMQIRQLGVEHVADSTQGPTSIDRPLPWAVPVFFSCLLMPLFV